MRLQRLEQAPAGVAQSKDNEAGAAASSSKKRRPMTMLQLLQELAKEKKLNSQLQAKAGGAAAAQQEQGQEAQMAEGRVSDALQQKVEGQKQQHVHALHGDQATVGGGGSERDSAPIAKEQRDGMRDGGNDDASGKDVLKSDGSDCSSKRDKARTVAAAAVHVAVDVDKEALAVPVADDESASRGGDQEDLKAMSRMLQEVCLIVNNVQDECPLLIIMVSHSCCKFLSLRFSCGFWMAVENMNAS